MRCIIWQKAVCDMAPFPGLRMNVLRTQNEKGHLLGLEVVSLAEKICREKRTKFSQGSAHLLTENCSSTKWISKVSVPLLAKDQFYVFRIIHLDDQESFTKTRRHNCKRITLATIQLVVEEGGAAVFPHQTNIIRTWEGFLKELFWYGESSSSNAKTTEKETWKSFWNEVLSPLSFLWGLL